MPETKSRVLIVSTDRTFIDRLTPAMAAQGLEPAVVPGLREASQPDGPLAAMLVDLERVPPAERKSFAALHKPQTPVILLETARSISPDAPAPLRRLSWPLPPGFTDQIRSSQRPVVILADQTLFTTAAVQTALQQAQVDCVSLEATRGLVEFLHQQREARLAQPAPAPKKSFWSLGKAEPAEAPPLPALGRVVVALFSDSMVHAESLDEHIRELVPEAVCYCVSSTEPLRAAAAALREGQPAWLMRAAASRLPELLAGASGERRPQKSGGRILLVDNFKPTLAALAQSLMGAGYDVVTMADGTEALRHFQPGAFQLAVICTAIVYAQHSGAELAQKLRERDPDLRIIFMVDRYPLNAALQGVSQVVELGLDDALLKPVESSRLIFSVQRALERRFLLLENARLLQVSQETNRQLGQINDFQKKFFAMVAHDVKNPLTAILGYAEVLGMRLKSNPNGLKCSSQIHSAAKTLNLLISDLVDLAAIESGKLRVEIGPLDLAGVVNEVRSRIDIVAGQRKIDFSVELPASLPPLAGDPNRLGQVMQNLCTNALQYTKEGGKVTLRVEAAVDKVTVSVIDTGIGIAKEDLPRIWERFFQTEEAKKMRKAGFGLGLKIAREIVQMHGGEMGIESELGKGSRFFFWLPVEVPGQRPGT